MITEALLSAVSAFWGWLVGVLPAPAVPSWYADAEAAFDGLVEKVDGLGAFLPFGVLGAVLGTLLVVAAVSLAVKVARIVASFLTMGGGSAA